jgi:hypothetical protein
MEERVNAVEGDGGRRALLALALLMAVAAVLRVLGTRNDLWLDEIISLGIAKDCKSAWQIFSAVHSDNNHYLNTLYLYFVKGASYAPVYRYLSVAFGVALVPAGYWMMERRSRVEALLFAGVQRSAAGNGVGGWGAAAVDGDGGRW